MPAIPLGQSAYRRLDDTPLRLVNMIFETLPTNLVDQVSLVQRGALVAFATAGAGPIRGVFRQDGVVGDNLAYVVSGTNLYSVTRQGMVSALGPIPGSGIVSMAATRQALLICNGAALYVWSGSALATISLPDGFTPTSVCEINSFFIVTRGGSQRFYWSDIGTTTFDALSYAAAENDPDDLVGAFAVEDELWLLGSESVEPWSPTGDSDLPFTRLNGRIDSEHGCANYATAARMDGTLLFVSAGRQVCRTDSKPIPISDHGVEQDLASVDLTSLRAWTYRQDGHRFYVLSLPTKTWAYNVATQKWSEFTSYGRPRFAGHLGATFADGAVLAGDDATGALYLVDPTANKDATGAMRRIWTGLIEVTGAPVRCDTVQLDCSVGVAGLTPPDDDPVVALDLSDDRGRTFRRHGLARLGRQGDYTRRPAWTRLGAMRGPGRVFRFEVTDDVRVQVRRATYNEPLR